MDTTGDQLGDQTETKLHFPTDFKDAFLCLNKDDSWSPWRFQRVPLNDAAALNPDNHSMKPSLKRTKAGLEALFVGTDVS